MIRTAKIKIKDCDYSITVMDGDTALRGLGVLAKFSSGPLGRLIAAKDDKAQLGPALAELGQHLGSEDFRDFVYLMLNGSTVTAKDKKGVPLTMTLVVGDNKETFKSHFAGEMGALIQLAWFALRENYGNFLEGLPGVASMIQRLRERAQVPSLQETMMDESPA